MQFDMSNLNFRCGLPPIKPFSHSNLTASFPPVQTQLVYTRLSPNAGN